MSNSHLKNCCGVKSAKEYKAKYGLYLKTALLSDELAMDRTKWLLTERGKERLKKVAEQQKTLKPNRGAGNGGSTIEHQNKFGTCPEQIKTRLVEFIHTNKELPTQKNRGKWIAITLITRYGSQSEGLKAHGLPWQSRGDGRVGKYHFPDGKKYQFNLQFLEQRDAFYKKMLEQCPILHP